ncbi:hypothetical protein NLI96_g10175 [Meripilus lineatus]|uniref:Uncharacterized protein n=1 Tax=Meripilus lineatus TaxID=2056292 RepID=A0AAD5UUE2_9APHY|nr:hypothetical protein NLI96_g10175 [Physisporinus lineatus]
MVLVSEVASQRFYMCFFAHRGMYQVKETEAEGISTDSRSLILAPIPDLSLNSPSITLEWKDVIYTSEALVLQRPLLMAIQAHDTTDTRILKGTPTKDDDTLETRNSTPNCRMISWAVSTNTADSATSSILASIPPSTRLYGNYLILLCPILVLRIRMALIWKIRMPRMQSTWRAD